MFKNKTKTGYNTVERQTEFTVVYTFKHQNMIESMKRMQETKARYNINTNFIFKELNKLQVFSSTILGTISLSSFLISFKLFFCSKTAWCLQGKVKDPSSWKRKENSNEQSFLSRTSIW